VIASTNLPVEPRVAVSRKLPLVGRHEAALSRVRDEDHMIEVAEDRALRISGQCTMRQTQ